MACSKQIPFGPDYCTRLADACLQNLVEASGKFKRLVDALVASQDSWSWGSGCSGTDAPDFAYKGIFDCISIRTQSGPRPLRHVFSAEKAQEKRRFLEALMHPERLVDDIYKLSAEIATEVGRSGGFFRPRLEFQNIDVILAGFVCKSVSALNNDAATAQTALSNTSTSTGFTFKAVVLFLERCRPKSVVLENVKGS